jgi:tetraacyldisaccharide 4'-kinase
MIDSILLFPYWLALKTRHFLFNKGIRKSISPEVPSICIGNITVGGTGKTPHTEMILRELIEDEIWGTKNIAVLSRGYKRQSKGFQQVPFNGSAKTYGDEPMQMKNKFPEITVAVDKSRKQGCNFLCNPELLQTSKKARKCLHKDLPKADLIILDDAFQHRAIKPTLSIVLVDYSRPTFKDHLLPLGRLRDLPERIGAADIIIVTKCPSYIDEVEKAQWAHDLGLANFDPEGCSGERKNGKTQHIFFSTIRYDQAKAVFEEGDPRYVYAQRLVLFTGIANDKPLRDYLSGTYKIVRHFNFPDHHKFTRSDISTIEEAAKAYPTSVIMTTEKDSQRVKDCDGVSEALKTRMFQAPIKAEFVSEQEKGIFFSLVRTALR